MGRRLSTYVHVDGQVYGPGVDVPDEVAERITNPDVWVSEPPSQAAGDTPKRASRAAKPKE